MRSRNATRVFCVALALIGAWPSQAAPAPSTQQESLLAPRDEAAIVSELESAIAGAEAPGAQVAIVFADGGTWLRGFGVRDIATAAPMTDETLLQAGSVTKIFTASLLADLVAKGTLRWSDSLGERLPGIPIRPGLASITLDELVTHTARLPANPPNRVDVDGIMQPYDTAQLHASLNDTSFELEAPGRHYSNWGYALLGHVVERATGQRFETVLKARIFEPLGMDASMIALSAAAEHNLATHYWPEDTPRVPRPRWVFGEIAAFGGITSTAGDLAKFLSYQMHPERRPGVLDATAVRSLREVRVLVPNWSAGGGRGWLVVRDREGALTLEHSGEVDGHSSYIGFSPEADVGIAVTANLGGSTARRIALPALARATAIARANRAMDRDQAFLLARKRQWIDAEAALAKITRASPGDAEAWHQLGVARYEMRDLQGAMSALTRAERAVAKPAASVFLLARIAASQGRIDDAFALLERALHADPAGIDLDLAELRSLHADARWTMLVTRHGALRRSPRGSATVTPANPAPETPR